MFESVEGKKFRALAQVFISIGAKYGNVSVLEVILYRTTVSHAISDTAEMLKTTVVQELQNKLVKYGARMTVNM